MDLSSKGHLTARVMQWQGEQPIYGDNLLPARKLTAIDARSLVRAKLSGFTTDIVFITSPEAEKIL